MLQSTSKQKTTLARVSSSKRIRAFTLIELLVVIAVIGILTSILIPAIKGARESALKAENTSNLRQMHQAAMAYANEHGGKLPFTWEVGANKNFITEIQSRGYIDYQAYKDNSGDYFTFNPALVEARGESIMGNVVTSYGVNEWITGGTIINGQAFRTVTNGYLSRIELPAKTALFMDASRNSTGTGWLVQLGGWPTDEFNTPDFSFPVSSIGKEDPDAITQVVYVDGHVNSVRRRDFIFDRDTPFWKGKEY